MGGRAPRVQDEQHVDARRRDLRVGRRVHDADAPTSRLGPPKARQVELHVALVEVDNPNAFDLGISGFNYQLNINQQSWGQGRIKQSGSIPKKGSATIEIPISVDIANMGRTAYQVLSNRQALQYQLTGGVTLDTGIEMLRAYEMPLDIKGTTALK